MQRWLGRWKMRSGSCNASFICSLLPVQALAIVLLLLSGRFVAAHRHEIRQQVIGIVTEVSVYILAPHSDAVTDGHDLM
jgi:hypothetical protein